MAMLARRAEAQVRQPHACFAVNAGRRWWSGAAGLIVDPAPVIVLLPTHVDVPIAGAPR